MTKRLTAGCGVNARTHKTFNNATPLMIAASKGHRPMVDVLLSWNAHVNAEDGSGSTALMLACVAGHWECVKSLLYSWSANLDKRNNTGSTALILTTSSLSHAGHLRCIELLLQQDADVHIKNDMDMTAIMYCMDSREFGLLALKMLMDSGAETDVLYTDGESLIMLAVRRGHLDNLIHLITHTNINMHLANDLFDNALIIALKSKKNNSQLVNVLLQAGSDPNSIAGSGCSAVSIAAATSFENTRLLISYGAVCKLSLVYIANKNLDSETRDSLQSCRSIFTPVDVAVLNGMYSTADFLLSYLGWRPFSLFESYNYVPLSHHLKGPFEIAIDEMLVMANQCPGWVEKVRETILRPKSLKQICLAVISQMLGCFPGRREKLMVSGLPPPLVRLVMLDVEEKDFF